jgi:site-specific DNA-cytosine methylase
MKTALSKTTAYILGGGISPTQRAGNSTILTAKKGDNMDGEKSVEDYLFTAKDGESYGVFKLTPRECGRLMGVDDKRIDKMFAVNSNSQCYKQYGNSIVVPVLMAIFSQLNIAGVKPWNDRTENEIYELIDTTTRNYAQIVTEPTQN